jgi:hypothetical protein
MKAGWTITIASFLALAGAPLIASAGHGRHHGGGHHGGGYAGGYGGECGCGSAPVQYAPPLHAQHGQPTPAVAQAQGGGYQSFSYSPTPDGEVAAAAAAPAVVANNPSYYQPAPMYGAPAYGNGFNNYGYGNNYGDDYGRGARVYNNVVNKSLGRHDYGYGRR